MRMQTKNTAAAGLGAGPTKLRVVSPLSRKNVCATHGGGMEQPPRCCGRGGFQGPVREGGLSGNMTKHDTQTRHVRKHWEI